MTIKQYTDSYSTPSTQIQNIVGNSVGILDEYVILQTGQNEYTASIYNPVTKKTELLTFSRNSSSSYNNIYNVVRQTIDGAVEHVVNNEYYSYSNVGYGQSLSTLPVQNGIISFGITAITVVLFFAIIFKGALFKCLRRKR